MTSRESPLAKFAHFEQIRYSRMRVAKEKPGLPALTPAERDAAALMEAGSGPAFGVPLARKQIALGAQGRHTDKIGTAEQPCLR